MSLDVNRRNFLKLIFTTTSAAAVSGLLPHWPAEALSRPIMEPVEFADDGYGYLIDPTMEYYDTAYPTFREWLGLEGLTPRQPKKQLKRRALYEAYYYASHMSIELRGTFISNYLETFNFFI